MQENINTQNESNTSNIEQSPVNLSEEDYLDLLSQKLEFLWGEDLDKNLLLVKRGLTWLGIDEQTKSEDINEITFLNKMISLGKLLSEDEIVSANQADFNLSPSEAKKIRLNMSSKKDVLEALNNKGNIKHKEILSYINKLNEIIAKENN